MDQNLTEIEKRIAAIESRNQQVENDKQWETSLFRKVIITVLTYLAIFLYFVAINIERPWLNAIVPSIGFLLSTLTLPFFKSIWEKLKN